MNTESSTFGTHDMIDDTSSGSEYTWDQKEVLFLDRRRKNRIIAWDRTGNKSVWEGGVGAPEIQFLGYISAACAVATPSPSYQLLAIRSPWSQHQERNSKKNKHRSTANAIEEPKEYYGREIMSTITVTLDV